MTEQHSLTDQSLLTGQFYDCSVCGQSCFTDLAIQGYLYVHLDMLCGHLAWSIGVYKGFQR